VITRTVVRAKARDWRALSAAVVLLGAVWGEARATSVEALDVLIGTDEAIRFERFRSDGGSLLIWLPSERGVSSRQAATAPGLAQLGTEVWIADLHENWFLVPGPRTASPAFLSGRLSA